MWRGLYIAVRVFPKYALEQFLELSRLVMYITSIFTMQIWLHVFAICAFYFSFHAQIAIQRKDEFISFCKEIDLQNLILVRMN